MTRWLTYKNETGRGPSYAIWGNLDIEAWQYGFGGYYDGDDFGNTGQHSTAQSTQKYASYIDTGVTIKQHATDTHTVQIVHDGTANDEGSIQAGGNAGIEVIITASALKRTAFEARIKKSSIADDAIGLFIGLGAANSAVADVLVDTTGAVKDQAMLGFQVLNAAGNGALVNVVYRKNGQAVQTLIAAAKTLVADTYVRLGFLIDPQRPPTQRGVFFVDGVEQATYLTQTQLEAVTFPSGVGLSRLFATKIVTAATANASMDWWHVAQEY